MRPRVLVTRPEPGASKTAARLSGDGYEPVILPLTLIAQMKVRPPDGAFDAVVVTSAQALKPVNTDSILHLPLFAVGETTADSATAAGFGAVSAAGGSVSSIAALVRDLAKPSARLLYLCGKVRRPELEAALAEAGFDVTAVETYDAVPVVYSKDALAARLGRTPFDAVTLMSAQASSLFSAIASTPEFAPLFRKSAMVCFSARIAKALPADLNLNVLVTREATEDALIECLARRFL